MPSAAAALFGVADILNTGSARVGAYLQLSAAGRADARVRATVDAVVAAHRQAGHRIVVVADRADDPLATALGADVVLSGTGVAVHALVAASVAGLVLGVLTARRRRAANAVGTLVPRLVLGIAGVRVPVAGAHRLRAQRPTCRSCPSSSTTRPR